MTFSLLESLASVVNSVGPVAKRGVRGKVAVSIVGCSFKSKTKNGASYGGIIAIIEELQPWSSRYRCIWEVPISTRECFVQMLTCLIQGSHVFRCKSSAAVLYDDLAGMLEIILERSVAKDVLLIISCGTNESKKSAQYWLTWFTM